MRSVGLATLLVLAMAGCGGQDSLMPLRVGDKRTYMIRFPFYGTVEPVEVVRQISVAGATGFELQGAMGMSRLAWRGSSLVADNLNHSRFAPAIQLISTDGTEGSWKGTITLLNTPYPSTATIEQADVTESILGRELSGRKSVLRIKVPDLQRTITVESTFLYGIGLVRQVQWSNGSQDIEIRLLQEPGKSS